jgi:uncharacterized RDD family membrane protein YckC
MEPPMANAPFPPLPYEPYVGFWRRVFATVIDSILISIALGSAAAILMPLMNPTSDQMVIEQRAAWLSLIVWWLYYALLESSPWQATLGKMVVGARVVDLAGARISFLQATGRTFGKILSSLILGIGFLMVAFNARKQALHDLMAQTLVVKASVAFAVQDQASPDRKLA